MPQSPANWLHLDLKGTMPDEPTFRDWLTYFAGCGFNGIVFEYEDRYPWQSWPDTYRPGFDRPGWQRIWQHCAELNLEVVPLVQTQGHLEWLLKHPPYRPMREDDHIGELCPQHPDAQPRLIAWIDEVIDAHPSLRYIHLGADETWNLASCPRCRTKAEQSVDGKLSVYIDHVTALCAHASSRGVRPMIWADMFWRENRTDLAARMPEDVVLIDWQYNTGGPWETTAQLAASGREVWGGSAVRRGYDVRTTQAPLGRQLENVLGWHRQREAGAVAGLVHTTWARSASMRPIYGPWEGWLPAFIAAGDPARWQDHPLAPWIEPLDAGIRVNDFTQIEAARDELARATLDDPLHQRCVDWWRLALDQRWAYREAMQNTFLLRSHLQPAPYMGLDTHMVQRLGRERRAILEAVDQWEAAARDYWRESRLTDEEEFIATRAGLLRWFLERDEQESAALLEADASAATVNA